MLDVPIIITPQGLEELQTTAHFMIFGSADVPLVSRDADVSLLGYVSGMRDAMPSHIVRHSRATDFVDDVYVADAR